MSKLRAWFLLLALLWAGPAWSQGTTFRSGALNPDVSANMALLGGYTSRDDHANAAGALQSGITLQEVEVRLSANADPFFRYELALAAHTHDGRLELGLEEAFLSTLAIPDLTLRAGQFLVNFGKANLQHAHARRFIDAPQPLAHVFGADHLLGTGVSFDYLAPLPFFTEVNLQAVHAGWTGEGHAHGQDPPVRRAGTEPAHDDAHLFAYVVHLKTFFDLTDALSLELGSSGLFDTDDHGHWQSALGGDLTFKWVPSDAARYRSFEWITEYMKGQRGGAELDGLYTGFRVQMDQRWWLQLRGALLDLVPDAENQGVRGSTLVAFAPSERTAIRLQYAYEDVLNGHGAPADDPGNGDDAHVAEGVHELFLQFIVSIGAHPAHAY